MLVLLAWLTLPRCAALDPLPRNQQPCDVLADDMADTAEHLGCSTDVEEDVALSLLQRHAMPTRATIQKLQGASAGKSPKVKLPDSFLDDLQWADNHIVGATVPPTTPKHYPLFDSFAEVMQKWLKSVRLSASVPQLTRKMVQTLNWFDREFLVPAVYSGTDGQSPPLLAGFAEDHMSANTTFARPASAGAFDSHGMGHLTLGRHQTNSSKAQRRQDPVSDRSAMWILTAALALPYSGIFLFPAIASMLALVLMHSRPTTSRFRALTLTPVTVLKWIVFICTTWSLQWYIYRAELVLLGDSGTTNSWQVIFHDIQMPIRYIICVLPVSLIAFVPWPKQQLENKLWRNDPDFLRQIAVVVPCHKCAGEIKEQLVTLLRHFEPHQIVFVDNANSAKPPDNLRQVIRETNPNLRYIYVPEGLKSQALHVGVEAMPDFKYVLLLDDDTQLQPNMVFDESPFLEDEKLAGIGWTRDVFQHNMVTSIVNFQLKAKYGQLRGSAMYALGGTNIFLVGMMALYRRDIWLKVMEQHPCTPYGEDAFTGAIALRMGYRLATEERNLALTFAPPQVFGFWGSFGREQGYGAISLFKQRAMRWNCTGMRTLPWLCGHILRYQCPDRSSGFFLRWMILRIVFQKLMPFIQPLSLFLLADASQLYTMLPFHLVSLYMENLSIDICINYIFWSGSGEQHQASILVILCTAVMDMVLGMFHVIGSVKCLTYDIWQHAYRWRVGTWRKFSHLQAKPAGEDEPSYSQSSLPQSNSSGHGAQALLYSAKDEKQDQDDTSMYQW